MKIKQITVIYEIKSKKEEQDLQAILGHGALHHSAEDAGAGEKGAVAYTPKSERTRLAYDALQKCQRVRLSSPEVIESYALAYPSVDLGAFFLGLDAWAVSNNVIRSPKGWAKSCTVNLRKQQDKSRGGAFTGNERSGIPNKPAAPVDPAVSAWAGE